MTVERSFTPTLESIREARLFVLGQLDGLPTETREEVALIVSELASNAVLHARTPYTVALKLKPSATRLRIEVRDQDSAQFTASGEPPPSNRLHGRGLLIVSRVAADWGVTTHARPVGKTVWAQVLLDPHAGSEANTKSRHDRPNEG